MEKFDLLVLGSGVAGVTAAETYRRLRTGDRIGLVGEELHPLYSRVNLPMFIKGEVERDRLFLRRLSEVERAGITVILGRRATDLDRRNQTLSLDDGSVVGYEKLLLATGGHARALAIPGSRLPGILTLRTVEDADLIRQRLETAQQAVAIGGAFIALEFLGVFLKYRLPASLVMNSRQLFEGLLDPEGATMLETWLERQGVTLYKQSEATAFNGSAAVSGVRLAEQALPADIVGLGVGITLTTPLYAASGLTVNQGVLTNEYFQTGDPRVYAAGDLAEFHDPLRGHRSLLGNWTHAAASGRVAGSNLAGEHTPYQQVTGYTSTALPFPISMIGEVKDRNRTRAMSDGGTAGNGTLPHFAQLVIRDNQLIGAILINRADLLTLLRRLILERTAIPPQITTIEAVRKLG